MRRLFLVVLLLALLVGAAAFVLIDVRGFSTRSDPSRIEKWLARAARSFATPRAARRAANPVSFSPEVWTEARAHFADHCAQCHANDGSGQTELGQNMYPKAPDMRAHETQRLTDGELYWIISNGVRLTGMPAWGSGGPDDRDTWGLVHFVRHLNELTPEHLEEMKALNPKSPEEYEEERQDREFLEGKPMTVPSPETKKPHVHKEE